MRFISRQQPFFRALLGVCFITTNLWLQGCATSEAFKTTQVTETTRTSQPARSVRSLAARINQHIQAPRFAAASWGIKIVSLKTGRTLFEREANKYFAPASNVKLYTGALALETFPPDYRMTTSLYATAPLVIRDGVLTSDLVLYGRGDPTLGAVQDMEGAAQPFDELAAQLAKLGIKRIRGKLIVDNSYFATPALGSGWQADDLQWYYGAPVTALNVYENEFPLLIKPAARAGLPCQIERVSPLASDAASFSIINRTNTTNPGEATGIGMYRDLASNTLYVFGSLATNAVPRRSSLALPVPSMAAGNELRAALARHQIKLPGKIKNVNWLDRPSPTATASTLISTSPPTSTLAASPPSPSWHHLASVTSPPLEQILQRMMKHSQNLYAQSLLLQVGQQTMQTTEASACAKNGIACSTEKWGIYALNTFLQQAGLPLNSVFLEEGSGLSRGDLVTPAATTALLQYMSKRPNAQIFFATLPIAGVDGSLRARMRGTAAANNAHAKTGSMWAIYALSGYVTTAAKEPLAFSIMLNNYVPPAADNPTAVSLPSPSQEIDAIVIMLAEFVGHG